MFALRTYESGENEVCVSYALVMGSEDCVTSLHSGGM